MTPEMLGDRTPGSQPLGGPTWQGDFVGATRLFRVPVLLSWKRGLPSSPLDLTAPQIYRGKSLPL